jgi:hypothetical protein
MSGDVVTIERIEQPPAPVPAGEGDAIISMIERAARDPSVDIDKFERLMAMKERADKHTALRAFNDAIAAAKGSIGPIIKNRVVDFTSQKGRTNYKHEDFAAVAAAVDPVLAVNGLSYRFRSGQAGGKLTVTCILSHRLGHSEETTLETGEDHSGNKNSTQAIGSAATYLQRYTLKLALGLASAHDDDGQKAGNGMITPAQIIELKALAKAAGVAETTVLERLSVETFDDISARQFSATKAGLITRVRNGREAD